MKQKFCTTLVLLNCFTQVRCASLNSALAIQSKPASSKIASPFSNYSPGSETAQNMILRTKKGDRTVEVEIPGNIQNMGEFALPLSPSFRENDRGPASLQGHSSDATGMLDESYKNRAPSYSDREILNTRSQGLPEEEQKRREIEESLSLTASEDSAPTSSSSYLGGVDHIKQLYRLSRIEVALIETDEMIKQYPTDAALYEMRGTLLDHLGNRELALQAWNQSLRFNPKNASLKRFITGKRSPSASASTP